MVELETLAAQTPPAQVLRAIERDGACIVANALDGSAIDSIVHEVMPYVENTRYGGDDFSGRRTRRTGALVARSPACRPVVMDRAILDIAKTFLAPYTEKILLHLTQTIFIGPGEGAQMFHRDRQAWGGHIPAAIEPQFNTIWALSDFTADNGATRVVPGSHKWDPQRKPEAGEVCQATMSKGSVLLYTGSVIHSGGENRTADTRMGLNITYCLGWLRQEENQFLSCPPHVARQLPQELQELLGYTMGNYALGYYSDPDTGLEKGAGILPPERAVGASPREKPAITN
jgi:ectoine hydroxylase-related dioxygenase (phytanoyl-CoA dioxygenase family)